MKKWMEKLIDQFDFKSAANAVDHMNEERATLLFMIDTFNKHLIEFEGHPVRKTREALDEFAKELLDPRPGGLERTLFRLRQFLAAYRVDEVAYFHKTFEEFRSIIWEFVDQLSEDIGTEKKEDDEIRQSLNQLKDAVEANSIEELKDQSRKFIDFYVEKQFKKEKRRTNKMKSIRKNLSLVKKQLGDANQSLRQDHLTGLSNRKTFEDYSDQHIKLAKASTQPVSLLLLDIDHFKRINDTYGHPIGDFVLKELSKTLQSLFTRECDLVARIGGEEFAILLPDYTIDNAMRKADEVLRRVRESAYVHEDRELRFTVSIGAAELSANETAAAWYKRTDLALYNSKNTGRNRATAAPVALTSVA